MLASEASWRCLSRAGIVMTMNATIITATSAVDARPPCARRNAMKRFGLRRMLLQIRWPAQRAMKLKGSAIHFRRHAAVSAAPINDQKRRETGLVSKRAMIVPTRKVMKRRPPTTPTKSERPKDGSSLTGFERGGPTARAPHDTQPSLRSPSNLKPQHGQTVNFVYLK